MPTPATICSECGANYMRAPHREGCTQFSDFVNGLIRRNKSKQEAAEAFIAEHFQIIEVS